MNVKFLINSNCNLKCVYCHNEYQGNASCQADKNKIKFSRNIILETLNEYGVNNIDNIKISGGEPFLKPKEVIKIMEFASSINKEIIILTNATVYNSALLNEIIKHNINEIRINLPTFDVFKYKDITKANDKETKILFNNIEYFLKNKIPISLNIVLMCRLEKIDDFVKKYLADVSKYNFKTFKSIRFIVNDWLPDKHNYFDKVNEVICSLTNTLGERRRGRIIDFNDCYIPISLIKCSMDEESDIYLLPPGIILTNYIKGRAYD